MWFWLKTERLEEPTLSASSGKRKRAYASKSRLLHLNLSASKSVASVAMAMGTSSEMSIDALMTEGAVVHDSATHMYTNVMSSARGNCT